MRSRVGEKRRLTLWALNERSGMIVYWWFLLRFDCFHLVSKLHESRIHSRSSGAYPILLFAVLLGNSRLDILPILLDPTVECTLPKADYKLVTLVSIIFRVFTLGDGEGESSLYLGQTLVKLTWAPWRSPAAHAIRGHALECKSVNKVANITDPPTPSPLLLILFLRCWISSPTNFYNVRRSCLLACFLSRFLRECFVVFIRWPKR